MYEIYINDVLFPVAPSKIDEKIEGNNKIVNLINQGEVNVLKSAKLESFKFELLLPNTLYKFGKYEDEKSFKNSDYYINILRKLMEDKKPFSFKLIRNIQNSIFLGGINIDVSLESFSIKEDAKNGSDVYVILDLKRYKHYETGKGVIVEETDDTITIEEVTERENTNVPSDSIYTVVSNDTLWGIAKKYYGDGSKYNELAKLNNLSNPNNLRIGQVLKL